MKRTEKYIEKVIIKKYNNGMSGYDISHELNIKYGTIYKILNRNSVKIRPVSILTKKQETQIIDLYNKKYSGYDISKKLNIKYGTIYLCLKRNKIITRTQSQIKRKYEIDDNCFDYIDTEWKSYFLGLIYADGYIRNNTVSVSLHKKDRHILQTLNKFIFKNKPLIYVIPKIFINKKTNAIVHASPQYKLQITNKKIANRLRELGIFQNKSLTIKFPNDSMIPPHMMSHFIRGYFDGDGCVQKRRWGQRFDIISSQEFCIKLNDWILKNLQINSKIVPHGKVYRVIICNKKDIYKIHQFLYNNSSLFLIRKYKIFKSIIDNINWEKVNRINYSKYKYVTFDKRRNTWIVQKKENRKMKVYGYFKNENDAGYLAKTLY